MRLIDADTLIEECYKDGAYGYVDALQISIAPTIEAEPVKHGHWIVHRPFENGKDNCNECIECSECNIWFGHDCYSKTNYCPNCGAKMDG